MYNDYWVTPVLNEHNKFNWTMAASFLMKKGFTGVITGVSSKVSSFQAILSPDREPITGTAKTTMIKNVRLTNDLDLLLINIHAINFVTQRKFERYIYKIIDNLKHHSGPIIWAGDFNTWNHKRLSFLDRTLAEYGLKRVLSTKYFLNLNLDHVYVRGCQLYHSKIYTKIQSSDHSPFIVDMNCER